MIGYSPRVAVPAGVKSLRRANFCIQPFASVRYDAVEQLQTIYPIMAQEESGKNMATLQTYANDMLALQKHILEAVEHQYADAHVKHDAKAYDLVGKLKSTLNHQVGELEPHIRRLGSEVMASAKLAVTNLLGNIAGLYNKIRKDPVSRMLRDDYTALNFSSVSYTQLYTTALAYGDQPLAATVLKHLNELTPIIIHINEIIPYTVLEELKDEGPGIDTSVAAKAYADTQQAWTK